jgi:toxin ParE1/3/4
MPLEVAFSPKAEIQLQQMEAYLANRFYPGNVRRYMDRLMECCLDLGKAPHRGRTREDLRPGLRVIGFERKASIYFTVVGEQVFIISVLYGGRTFESTE